ncbi:ABC-three component system protein [Paenibacillus sp. FSL H3-0469]|uniref:ABC-three component system protein n=1 Tax=Paenibacillus sp. FSL H3-0469 TaxID=2954506 RepID=UPI0031016713
MLNKLRLDQTKRFERHLALEEITNMLLHFFKGNASYLSIGAEQGSIDKWDDFVIEKNGGGNIYIQAKRQTTGFSSDAIIRNTYIQGKRAGAFRDLSPLDESIESLANWIKTVDFSSLNIKDEFWLVLPNDSIKIKTELEIRHLRNLFENQFKSVTTSGDLENLASVDKNAKNIYNWLISWCGFDGWEHILKLIRVLKIKTPGQEPDIICRVKNNLNYVFQPNEVDKVISLIFSYMDENETFSGAIRPRQLLYQIQEYLLPDIEKWTLFQNNDSTWHISGINDLQNNSVFERPAVIIPSLWAAGNPNVRKLKIEGASIENCHVTNSLMRLLLHPHGSFDIICSDKSSWESIIKNKTGGTLGVTKNDLNGLRILDGLTPLIQGERKGLLTIDDQEQYANELHVEMYKRSFELISSGISNNIRNMTSGDLRTEVEKRWSNWKHILENSIDEQKKLFVNVLHPRAEGDSISGELRVGPQTTDLLVESIFLLLVVSVCLGDEENTSWKAVNVHLKMHSIGLAYWSGPAEGLRKIIKIDDDKGIGKLLEKEAEEILIISQSELTETEVFNGDILGEITKRSLLTHPRYPKLLITRDRIFVKKLENGNISDLREYLIRSVDEYKINTQLEIDKIADGVMI